MKCRLRGALLIASAVLLALLPASTGLTASMKPATQAVEGHWDIEELTRRADLIVHGRVVEQASAWNEYKTTIVTDSVVEIANVVKGRPDKDRLMVRTEGGVVDGVRVFASATPHFTPGEVVLIFLERSPAGRYRVTGWEQGKFAIREGWAVNDPRGTAVPLTSLVEQVAETMEMQGIASALPADWRTRFPQATAGAPEPIRPLEFVYDGFHWPRPGPIVEYLVNAGASQDVTPDEARQAVQAGADTWTSVLGANFGFEYGGESPAKDFDVGNGQNDVTWKDKGDTFPLGRAQFTADCDDADCTSGTIREADMVINEYYQFDASGSPADGEIDLQSVALHEFGHFLHLGHDSNEGTVMYPTILMGTTKRSLHANDIAGIRCIYPSADFDGDGTVTTDELAEFTQRWRLSSDDEGYDEVYDLNGDGVIDVIDLELAAAGINSNCG